MWGAMGESGVKVNTYDQIAYVLRCMVDCKVSGTRWRKGGAHKIRSLECPG
jgi:hypothetical protein